MSYSEDQILKDLQKLASGQSPSDMSPEYMEVLGSRFMEMADSADALLEDPTEAEYETRRTDITESGLDPQAVVIDTAAEIKESGAIEFTHTLFNKSFNVDMVLKYVAGFRGNFGKLFWEDVVLKDLRKTIGTIFKTQGLGQWGAHGELWSKQRSDTVLQADAAMILGRPLHLRQTSVSHFQRGGGGILNWRGKYRNALVRPSGVGRGAFFEPESGDWGKGFRFGVDQPYFTDESERIRGDNLEADYPTKHETRTAAQFYYFWLRKSNRTSEYEVDRIVVTGKERRILEAKDIPVYFAGVYKGSTKKTDIEEGEESGEGDSFQPTVPARPLWSIFNARNATIDGFYDKIRDNIANRLERYLSLGERTRWKGDPSAQPSTIEGLPDMYRPTEEVSGFRIPPESMLRNIRENPAERRRLEEIMGYREREKHESTESYYSPDKWIDTEDEDDGGPSSWEADYNFDDF